MAHPISAACPAVLRLGVLLAVAAQATMPALAATPAQLQSTFGSLSGLGWVGSDGAYSIALGDGRVAWLFGDTITSSVSGISMVHNSIVITGPGRPKVIIGPVPSQPDGAFHWPGAAHLTEGELSVLCERVTLSSSGWKIIGISLARFDTRTWTLLALRPVPGADGTVPWGSTLFDHRGYTYVYGVEYQGADLLHLRSWLHIARVRAGRLDLPWRYFTGLGWSPKPASSVRTLTGVSGSPSLIDLGTRGLRLVSQQGMLGERVLSWRAANPTGPFTAPRTVYTIPNMGPKSFVYLAHAHPAYATSSRIPFSYSTNTFGSLTGSNIGLYRPRFFSLPVSAL